MTVRNNSDHCTVINPKKGGRFWQLRRRGGSYVPTEKQSTAEATIFNLHQNHVELEMFTIIFTLRRIQSDTKTCNDIRVRFTLE